MAKETEEICDNEELGGEDIPIRRGIFLRALGHRLGRFRKGHILKCKAAFSSSGWEKTNHETCEIGLEARKREENAQYVLIRMWVSRSTS